MNTHYCRLASFVASLIFVLISSLFAASITEVPLITKNALRAIGEYKSTCPVGLDRLVVVQFPYYDFNGQYHRDGEIIVLDAVSEHVHQIFQKLAKIKFPINAAKILRPNQSGDIGYPDNNTAGFDCRPIRGDASLISLHSYGLAIDVNPEQNPAIMQVESEFWGILKILPPQGSKFINRLNQRPGMVESILNIFKKHGFSVWGGRWNSPVDWMHVQPSRAMAQLLVIMNKADGKKFFELYVSSPGLLNSLEPKDLSLNQYYKKDRVKFMKLFTKNPQLMTMTPKQALIFLRKYY